MVARLTTTQRTLALGAPGQVRRVVVTTPWGIRTQVHERLAGVFLAACDEAQHASQWKPRRVDGYNYRAVRGSTAPSLHGWAAAWDFFATPPGVAPPGGVWTPHNAVPAEFARPFTRRGFTWGAGWQRKDIPHIEWAGMPPAGPPHVGPSPSPPLVWADRPTKEEIMGLPVLRTGHRNHHVRIMQGLLIAHAPDIVAWTVGGWVHVGRFTDGIFGPQTSKVLRDWQLRTTVLAADGVCGPATWSWLTGVR